MVEKLLEYFNGDELAASAWLSKYAAPGEETPEDMHRRLAHKFWEIERQRTFIEGMETDDRMLNALSTYGQNREDLSYDRIFEYFDKFKQIIPQGSVMAMLGREDKVGSLSNCFVIGQPKDSYGGIMQKDEELVQLMKRRGGVGIDLSTLRPSGTNVSNAAKTSTGAASFMHRYSNSTREVAQGGRRGALMITMDVRHPDILDFVNMKQDKSAVTGANVSVMLTDDFMEAVKKDEDYVLRFPCDVKLPANFFEVHKLREQLAPLSDGQGNQIGFYKVVKAKEIYDAIVFNAWDNAEPGQMFVDRHHDYSPESVYPQFKGVTTNPCGEIFMQPYDACRLMALNLLAAVKDPFTDNAELDLDKLYELAYEMQRLADDLVDLEIEAILNIIEKIGRDDLPEETKRVELDLWNKILETAQSSRRTGSGITALGDMLAAIGLSYDSELGMDAINIVFKTIFKAQLDCSIDLAILHGSFEGYDFEKEYESERTYQRYYYYPENSFYKMLQSEFKEQFWRMKEYGRRNVSWSTVAPTGTVSLMAQTTSGLEPLFAPYYIRKKKGNPGDEGFREDSKDQNGDSWMHYPVVHPKLNDWIQASGIRVEIHKDSSGNPEIVDVDITNEQHVKLTFANSPWMGSCAPDIDWIKRVEIQGIILKYTTHSISSTINLPNDATQEDIAAIYEASWEQGLKGVTVYRDGCRTGVLVTSDDSSDEFAQHDAIKRGKSLDCDIYHVTGKGERFTVIVGLKEGKPYEVFAVHGEYAKHLAKGKIVRKARHTYYLVFEDEEIPITEFTTNGEALATRLASTCLRHGTPVQYVAEQLDKSEDSIVGFGKALARTLKKYISDDDLLDRAKCEDCGSTNLRLEEGCLKCLDCGSSKCG